MSAIGDIRVSTDGQVQDGVSLSGRIDTTSTAGKMIFRMLAVLAEFEHDQTPNTAELETIERMTALRADGVSLRRIAQVLPEQGIPTKTGAVWSGQAVYRILTRGAA
jgi:hypothetical protein